MNLIDTKFNFSEKLITKFSVKNLNCSYIRFKLIGEYGEKVSKKELDEYIKIWYTKMNRHF